MHMHMHTHTHECGARTQWLTQRRFGKTQLCCYKHEDGLRGAMWGMFITKLGEVCACVRECVCVWLLMWPTERACLEFLITSIRMLAGRSLIVLPILTCTSKHKLSVCLFCFLSRCISMWIYVAIGAEGTLPLPISKPKASHDGFD